MSGAPQFAQRLCITGIQRQWFDVQDANSNGKEGVDSGASEEGAISRDTGSFRFLA